MGKKTSSVVPDAWEDEDWESQADKAESVSATPGNASRSTMADPAPRTREERLARHTETNRKIWESADSSRETFHFLEANNTVPLTSTFKPQVKVLSRKPPPTIARRDPGIAAIGGDGDDGDDDDDYDGQSRKQESLPTPEEIRARQKLHLEEKQRRYQEARAKIFGESNPTARPHSSSGASSASTTPASGQVTPTTTTAAAAAAAAAAPNPHSPFSSSSSSSNHGGGGGGGGGGASTSRGGGARGGGGGRGRGGRAGGNGSNSNSSSNNNEFKRKNGNYANGSGANINGRELIYEPNYSPKPDYRHGRGDGGGVRLRPSQSPQQQQQQQQPAIRAPRGPDGSGRGGFGFARRGPN